VDNHASKQSFKNAIAYFVRAESDAFKMFMQWALTSQGPYLQHFFLFNLPMSSISYSVCPWQAFPA
jgi:hypothetical protein